LALRSGIKRISFCLSKLRAHGRDCHKVGLASFCVVSETDIYLIRTFGV